MGWFGSGRGEPAFELPKGTAQRIAAFGRRTYNHTGNADDYMLEPDMYQLAQRDQEAFLVAMVALSVKGGWLAYGVEHLVVSVIGGDLKHPAFDVIMENALRFMRERGEPFIRLTGYESSFWSRHHAGEPW